MKIERAQKKDIKGLLHLYAQLTKNPLPDFDENPDDLWAEILSDPRRFLLVAKSGDAIVSACDLLIVTNLTHSLRPYAFIENVITDEKHQNKGYATAILREAKEIAVRHHCYKIMLMTGSKKESTLNLYRKAGYNDKDKTAFIQWLP